MTHITKNNKKKRNGSKKRKSELKKMNKEGLLRIKSISPRVLLLEVATKILKKRKNMRHLVGMSSTMILCLGLTKKD